MKRAVIRVENLCKTFDVYDESKKSIRDSVIRFWRPGSNRKIVALSNISFNVFEGELFGIVGRNGSGKSTLLNCIIGVMRGDKNDMVHTQGRIMRLAMGMGFDPNLSARENIYVNGSIIGLSFKEIGGLFDEIIEFAGLEKFIDVPIKTYSQGMQTRLKFSIAIHARADIFLLDEFFGGTGDAEFQVKSRKVFEKTFLVDRTVVMVSHNLSLLEKHCDRILWIEYGQQMMIGPAKEVILAYKNSAR